MEIFKMTKELTLILLLFTGAVLQNQWQGDTEHRAEVKELRTQISSFSAQQKTVDTFEYKYTSPIEKEDFVKLTSPFGYRELLNPFTGGTRTSNHMGLDMVGKWHCEIRPVDMNGEVIDVWMPPNGYYKGHEDFGGFVRIKHLDKWISGYPHLSSIYVREGDKLIDGVFYRNGKVVPSVGVLGRQGNTGISTGEHLHLSIQKPDGLFVNPLRWVEL